MLVPRSPSQCAPSQFALVRLRQFTIGSPYEQPLVADRVVGQCRRDGARVAGESWRPLPKSDAGVPGQDGGDLALAVPALAQPHARPGVALHHVDVAGGGDGLVQLRPASPPRTGRPRSRAVASSYSPGPTAYSGRSARPGSALSALAGPAPAGPGRGPPGSASAPRSSRRPERGEPALVRGRPARPRTPAPSPAARTPGTLVRSHSSRPRPRRPGPRRSRSRSRPAAAARRRDESVAEAEGVHGDPLLGAGHHPPVRRPPRRARSPRPARRPRPRTMIRRYRKGTRCAGAEGGKRRRRAEAPVARGSAAQAGHGTRSRRRARPPAPAPR